MQFEARRVDETPNLPQEHPLVEAGWLFAGIGTFMALVFLAIFFSVELVVAYLPLSTEKQLLAQFNSVTEGSESPDTKQELKRPRQILSRMGKHWKEDPYQHTLFIIESRVVNAVALPGGAIGVTQGLLEQTAENDEALAFILAHELGHFAHRHHLRSIGRGLAMSLGMMAIGVGGSDLSAGQWLNSELTRHLSVDAEAEADEFAFQILCEEYGSTRGASSAFSLFPQLEGMEKLTEILSDHPTTPSRIQAAEAFSRSSCR